MVTRDEKWATYYNIVRKRSRSNSREAAETVTKPGLTNFLELGWEVLMCPPYLAPGPGTKLLPPFSRIEELPE
ncbi:hypothetical protein TNCV_2008771 [Trichonephila clavipes]|nr:hypothetical protein TNCV_2008771 [Trichonephila clavipes]